MAKVAVDFGLQMLHPFQIIVIGTGASRNAMLEVPSIVPFSDVVLGTCRSAH